ncbi:hypothetical protein PYCCODRAFT_1425574 [Trametes coccinea BRFM310]|uniref:Fungal-type protein kinase domain-containing protein n=1 Tax=Trametes coccinea (strain BRFM310) TaxID=1353009 RepID=A0A1Y2IPG4_TRAC3|nr:hypothetical protein PYCCODRAFT_1425574 [Trametes coccinea BRFM310]
MQRRYSSTAHSQGTADVTVDETSGTHANSGEMAHVESDPAFFDDHLKACPRSVVEAIEKRNDVQRWVADICKVKRKDASLYQPVASLLTTISQEVFGESLAHETYTYVSLIHLHADHLQNTEDKDRLHLPERPIIFLDHHSYIPTHFPIGRVDDKPDVIGVLDRERGCEITHDGTYEGVPYHCIETIVEAKTIYDNGQAQVTRYAFNLQQARPDRPGLYCLSVKPYHFQVVYSSSVGIEASDHKPWDDYASLCAYIYSLYDPPEGHVLYDRTIVAQEPAGVPLGKPTWTIETKDGVYSGAVIIFLGNPWGRGTTVFQAKRKEHSVIIKDSYIDCGRRNDEAELLQLVHEDGRLPGVVRCISAEDVKNGDQTIISQTKDCTFTRKKRRIVLADIGQELYLAKSVNDLLMTIYDILEVHRTLARDRQILHRDMSIYNILMHPVSASYTSDLSKDAPPLIDDVLQGELRPPEKRTARCLIIDLDHAASLASTKAGAIPDELQCRTGTPAYIARSVASGALYIITSTLNWTQKMPELSGEAKKLYTKLYGEDRYNKYLDSHDTIHGGGIPQETEEETDLRASGMTFYHQWEHDAESIFWTMYAALLRVVPEASPKESEDSREALNLNATWKVFHEHTIPRGCHIVDPRDPLLAMPFRAFCASFLPAMQEVALLIKCIARHVYPSYALMTPPPPHEDHLHEAMQRLILQYLVDHRNNPIPLVPGKLRPVSCDNDPVIINRGTYGISIQDQEPRGQKRQRTSTDGTQVVRELARRDSASEHDVPPPFREGFDIGRWFLREREATEQ